MRRTPDEAAADDSRSSPSKTVPIYSWWICGLPDNGGFSVLQGGGGPMRPLSSVPMFVITSSLYDRDISRRAMSLGASAVLCKPLSRREVARRVGAPSVRCRCRSDRSILRIVISRGQPLHPSQEAASAVVGGKVRRVSLPHG